MWIVMCWPWHDNVWYHMVEQYIRSPQVSETVFFMVTLELALDLHSFHNFWKKWEKKVELCYKICRFMDQQLLSRVQFQFLLLNCGTKRSTRKKSWADGEAPPLSKFTFGFHIRIISENWNGHWHVLLKFMLLLCMLINGTA